MRIVPSGPPDCLTRVAQAIGALQLLASATACCDVAGSSVSAAAAMSLAGTAESVASLLVETGPPNPIQPGARLSATTPAVISEPASAIVGPEMVPKVFCGAG